MKRRILAAVAVAVTVPCVYLALHVTVGTYVSAEPNGTNHGVVVGWRGHAPGPVQCFGYEYGADPGPFVNVDC